MYSLYVGDHQSALSVQEMKLRYRQQNRKMSTDSGYWRTLMRGQLDPTDAWHVQMSLIGYLTQKSEPNFFGSSSKAYYRFEIDSFSRPDAAG